jgi:hypothetical protein
MFTAVLIVRNPFKVIKKVINVNLIYLSRIEKIYILVQEEGDNTIYTRPYLQFIAGIFKN